MVHSKQSTSQIQVDLRIRPLTGEEVKRNDQELLLEVIEERAKSTLTLTAPKTANDEIEYVEILGGFKVPKSKPQRVKKYRGFKKIVQQDQNNHQFFQSNVLPLVQQAVNGKTACCFAYGHTGSGKTHTILGYGDELGMYHQASQELFTELDDIYTAYEQAQPEAVEKELHAPKVKVHFYEVYNGDVYDLLNDNAKCFVREDAHGKIRIRGETVTDEDGLVRPTNSTFLYADSHQELLQIVQQGIQARATGNSNVHEHSSRSHAILELEITSQHITDIREEIADIEAKITSLGHECDTIEADIFRRQHYKVEGMWVKKPDAQGSTADESKLMAQLKKEIRQKQAQLKKEQVNLENAVASGVPCLGGTLLFVDLAGSEHAGSATDGIVKTEKEQAECREINKSLSALKACFRALASGMRSGAVYRGSKLTLVLRDHFRSNECKTLMISTLSPSAHHIQKTIHTLQYAQIVALC